MMKLRGVDYGTIFCAPGSRGFFREGYRIHRFTRPAWGGTGFAAKTGTMEKWAGNMTLGEDGITPVEIYPRSILVKLLSPKNWRNY